MQVISLITGIADEIFFTGTAAEITPICQVDNRTISAGTPGPITKQLQGKFYECVRGNDSTHKDWLTFV